jgi:hypothetical protein
MYPLLLYNVYSLGIVLITGMLGFCVNFLQAHLENAGLQVTAGFKNMGCFENTHILLNPSV